MKLNYEDLLKLLVQINTMMPFIMGIEKAIVALFKDATPNLSNTERVALLRTAGIKVEDKGEAWFALHGLTV